jgi:hypothetical protein
LLADPHPRRPRIDGDGDIRDVIELLRLVYDQAAPRDGLPREV